MQRHPIPRRPFALTLGLAIAAGASGCSRQYYRARADREARCLVEEKAADPRWTIPDFSVYPDHRSRFFDPFDPDHPPMPPDDPSSHVLMHSIYKLKHSREWHRDGDIDDVENPHWREYLATYARFNEGALVLDLPTAVQLARIHSRNYQDNFEEVYLAALDVAFERFRFDVQYFGRNSSGVRLRGAEPAAVIGRTGPAAGSASSIVDTQTSLGASRRFAAGGELLAGFANSLVWQFAGSDTNFSTSIVNFSLVQPLLREGGRQVALERLTRAERSLLAAVRAEARFRQEFFRSIAVGESPETEPRRIGGFLGGAGLSGFTGTGGGGFGGVGATTGFGGFGGRGAVGAAGAGGGAGLAGGGEGRVGGFYGLVQQLQAIRNTENSLAAQLDMLDLLEFHFRGGLIDLIQVDEFRQNIETERSSLLRSRVAFQDSLELFLSSTLGMPPSLTVAVDDSLLAPFQLVSEQLSRLEGVATQLRHRLGAMPPEPQMTELTLIIVALRQLYADADAEFRQVRRESKALERDKADRLRSLESQKARAEYETELRDIGEDLDDWHRRFTQNVETLAQYEKLVAAKQAGQLRDALVSSIRKTSSELQELTLLQNRIRVKKVAIAPIQLDEEDALLIARDHRLDWMNRRAALVDQWRLIALNANNLKGALDVEIDGDLGTVGDNPIRFRGSTGGLRARMQFDAPLNRKAERNLYRESIINYQQAKRGYIAYVDRVALTIRSRLRLLRRLAENLDIQRRALEIAIRRVDQTREALYAPFAPPEPGKPPASLGPTLAQNLLRALSDLRNTQDNFLSVWVNYEATRMSLMIDLGLMQLDENGIWVDVGVEQAVRQIRAGDTELLPGADGTTVSTTPAEKTADLARRVAELDAPDRGSVPDALAPADALQNEHKPTTNQADVDVALTRSEPPCVVWRRQMRSGESGDFGVEDFVAYLPNIRRLCEQGKSAVQIARETALPLPVVRAFLGLFRAQATAPEPVEPAQNRRSESSATKPARLGPAR
jgi:hypothetical protein